MVTALEREASRVVITGSQSTMLALLSQFEGFSRSEHRHIIKKLVEQNPAVAEVARVIVREVMQNPDYFGTGRPYSSPPKGTFSNDLERWILEAADAYLGKSTYFP